MEEGRRVDQCLGIIGSCVAADILPAFLVSIPHPRPTWIFTSKIADTGSSRPADQHRLTPGNKHSFNSRKLWQMLIGCLIVWSVVQDGLPFKELSHVT